MMKAIPMPSEMELLYMDKAALDSALTKANARIMELEASIRSILAINEECTLCDEASEGSQSMELAKVLDTAECLVGWKQ